jgi:hypothetical protein
MRKPPANSQTCPRCKLISPRTAIECECGYDLRANRSEQRGQMLERPGVRGRRVLGAFLILLAGLIWTALKIASGNGGVPGYIVGYGSIFLSLICLFFGLVLVAASE